MGRDFYIGMEGLSLGKPKILIKEFKRLFRFGLSGILLIFICFPLNYILVEFIHFSKPIAYTVTILVNLVLGFLINQRFVFDSTDPAFSLPFFLYTIAFFSIRGIDWGVYVIQVNWIGVYYLTAQAINLFVFFMIKYFVYGLILTNGKDTRRELSSI